jgi:NADPH-dependent glutamate synthase beta subunit-like oxidoreductase/Na+-translocating ferredoxin:NAD+ oxidoreductase RNF subunit RnfB
MLEAAAIIGGIGAVSALGLGAAARAFAVYVDPKVLRIEDALPGANCGGCGYTGCAAAARAVARGKAGPGVCVAGGHDVAEAVAAIVGLSVVSTEPHEVELGCKYSSGALNLRFDYDGIADCRAAALVGGGGKRCSMGCIGLGTCVRACPFGALYQDERGMPQVIADRCTGCGTCERSCPKGILRVNSPSLRFTHVQTRDDCVAPCQATCPAQIDIPGYIGAIGRGEFLEAVRIIKESNPFPLVCGRVCPHPCEAACRRNEIDSAVDINHLKRFAADYEMNIGEHVLPPQKQPTGRRVAVVGAGPSGLTCAYYLARQGHSVTVFEGMPRAGGMLRYGIPEYRLPKKVLDWEIEGILALGVELECSKRLGEDFTLEDLGTEGFEAIYLAIGAWSSRRLGVPGEDDYAEVASGTDFLIRRGLEEETRIGRNVVIVGGGNTAMDCARTSWRLGAENVYLLYRRSRAEMPANDIEVEEAEREGVQYRFLSAPTKLLGNDGRLEALEFQRMELGEPDASGRRRPVPVEGSETRIEVDNVFNAVGQSPDLTCLGDGEIAQGIGRTRWGSIEAEEGVMRTSIPTVFTGGDDWRGAATAVEAIRDGRFAARAIHQLLLDEAVEMPESWLRQPPTLPGLDPRDPIVRSERVRMPELGIDERRGGFSEVELGLTEEMARKESQRCLQCGLYCYSSSGSGSGSGSSSSSSSSSSSDSDSGSGSGSGSGSASGSGSGSGKSGS